MRSADFFDSRPVFTLEEFVASRAPSSVSLNTAKNLLARQVAAGRLMRVKRGLYAAVPRGADAHQATVDPYVLTAHLARDAVVAYHAALQFFGKSYSVWRRFHYLAAERKRPLVFRDLEFIPVQVPKTLRSLPEWGGGVTDVRHGGARVRVTTLERTLVDVLDAPERSGGWEEVWRSLEMVEYFDTEVVVAYSAALASSLTAARVGFFLDQHRQELMVEDIQLRALRKLAPREPRYLDGSRTPGRLVKGWNLIVPEFVLERRWAEVG